MQSQGGATPAGAVKTVQRMAIFALKLSNCTEALFSQRFQPYSTRGGEAATESASARGKLPPEKRGFTMSNYT